MSEIVEQEQAQTRVSSGNPPNRPNKAIGSGFYDDNIRAIGDAIAGLKPQEAKQLLQYIDAINTLR
jgi:hypothetical protein